METTFDPLKALSEARTALDDPTAVGLVDPGRGAVLSIDTWEKNADYAIEKIDGVLGALSAGHGNDMDGEVIWALKNIGRLLVDVADEYGVDEGVGGDGEPFGPDQDVLDEISLALDAIDRAIEALS